CGAAVAVRESRQHEPGTVQPLLAAAYDRGPVRPAAPRLRRRREGERARTLAAERDRRRGSAREQPERDRRLGSAREQPGRALLRADLRPRAALPEQLVIGDWIA